MLDGATDDRSLGRPGTCLQPMQWDDGAMVPPPGDAADLPRRLPQRLPKEAVEAPPWHPGLGEPIVQTWERLTRPTLAIYVRDRWRRCPLISRQRLRDGRTIVQVDIHLDSDTSYQARTYWWDGDAMYITKAGDPPFEP